MHDLTTKIQIDPQTQNEHKDTKFLFALKMLDFFFSCFEKVEGLSHVCA